MGQPIWTGAGYDYSVPDMINPSSIVQNYQGADGNPYDTYQQAYSAQAGLGDSASSGTANSFYGFSDPALAQWSGSGGTNYRAVFDESGNLQALVIKSGDKQGTVIPYTMDASGNYVPDYAKVATVPMDTNSSKSIMSAVAVVAGGLAAGFGAAALGMEGASMAGMTEAVGMGAGGAGASAYGGAAPGEAAGAFTGSYPSAYAAPATGGLYGPPEASAGYAPGTGAYGPPSAGSPASYGYTDPSAMYGGSSTAAYPSAPGASTGGTTGWPDVTGTNPTTGMPTTNDYMKYLSAAGSAMPSSSGSSSGGSPLGALVGAGLGYLDSANQPNSLTTSSQLDPAMAQLIYGQNGLVSMGANAVNANGGQYIDAAGQQISQMGQQGPTPYNELVANNQALWSANPFLAEQQKAITEQMNTNFANNTLPAIGTSASMNGGYGGSRQGVAQGLASTGNSTATANALTGLAYNSWNDSQNRAMQGTQYQGQYGLASAAQQAAMLQQGANMQAGAPWYNVNQFGNMIHQIPTTGSQTTPLFNNTTAGALGGAQTGYNYDWGSLISGIGGLFK